MDSTPIYQYPKPMSASLKPPEFSEPIITPGYELRPYLIKLIQDKSFSGEGDENPYSHLLVFEILLGRAKQWYSITIGSMQGD